MNLNFSALEHKILEFWKKNKIFEKSIKQRSGAGDFVFYEGPPTANGKPGIHHVLARTYKDIICRYKTMQGFRVLRKAGWDTHGLPVELEIEKKLGLKNKKDIEKYGIAQFNKKCKESVWQHKDEWEKLTERIGFWLDMKNPYITYENNYIESLWRIIKQVHQKGLLYKDYKVVPYCSRCGTSLSSHEVAQGYERVKEPAIYVKFKIKIKTQNPKTFLLAWTTTPWTLPGNVAIAVNKNFVYCKVKTQNSKLKTEYLILAKARLNVLDGKYEIIEEFKGEKLLGLKYERLFMEVRPPERPPEEVGPRVIAGDFVSLDEGTGLVHIAPAFGEDDMLVGKENNLPVLMTVDQEGKMIAPDYEWDKMFVKDADPLVIKDLEERGILFREELYEHDYPFCWRCHLPLLYYAKQSWFINMQKIKDDLIKNNQKINWVPGHLKEGRFGEWLREIKDWAFSRERYWGTPLPIWQCKKCGHQEVIGGKKDLLSQKFSNNNYYLIRHGHSLRQIKNVASCWPEKTPFPLTKKGKKGAGVLAKNLKKDLARRQAGKIDIIFSSDLLRAKQTSEILSEELGAKIIFDKRLREFNVGIFNGKDAKLFWQYLSKQRNIILDKPPKGESVMEAARRIFYFLKEVNQKYQNKNILIVSHESPLSLLQGTLSGWSLEKILEWRKKARDKLIQPGKSRKIEFKDWPLDEKMELDPHRPYIDEVKFFCPKCQEGLMERVREVIDCWFDSGAMSFAQYARPFDGKFQFPADYISEAIDQTRGWFYTLLAISTLLGYGAPYKNVISLGHVLDEKGEKMSKSKGNVVDPWAVVGKYGADAARWYFYIVNQPGDVKLFAEKDIAQTLKKFIMTFWNSYLFFKTYRGPKTVRHLVSNNVLDRWVVSRLNELILETAEKLDKYDVTGAARAIDNFVVNDLSLWYIRRSRKRFAEAAGTLAFVLQTVSKLTAPFIPFLSEEIYKGLGSAKPSVHLEDWPRADKKLIDQSLSQKMMEAREMVSLALAERAKAGIKVRQPLNKLQIPNSKLQKEKELLELIKEEVNVKEITFGKGLKLNTKITPELKEEGIVREVIRQIQEMRKKAGCKPHHQILIQCFGAKELNDVLTKNKAFILKETKAKKINLKEKLNKTFDIETERKVDYQNLWLAIKKL